MSNLTIKNRTFTPTQVTKLPAGQELSAMGAAAHNGADDVLIKVGQDHYMASGRGLPLGGVKTNDVVTIDGREGRVVAVDKQLNSFKEGILAWPGLAVGGLGAAWGVGGFIQGILAGANMAGLGLIIAVGAVVLGVAINLAPALYGAFRKVDV
ncbi:MAG: hypothetical protein JWM80_5604 [Cyanobacteria bacterium RYN_339]|nr:hypothetical protein [Cyanobacteria bacterium RYN_339]